MLSCVKELGDVCGEEKRNEKKKCLLMHLIHALFVGMNHCG